MAESPIMNSMRKALAIAGSTVFRNNVGQTIAGKATWIREHCTVKLRPGDVVVRGGRVFHAGLFVGSGDLIGWTEVVVTPEMVGTTVAVFTSVEAKDKTKSSDDQKKWRRNVLRAGGFAGEAHSDAEALAIIGK